MQSTLKTTDLTNVANGAALELFARELEAVLANIQDPNTPGEFTREVTLTIKIKPDPKRDAAAVMVFAKSKLAPVREAIGSMYFGKRSGKAVAYTQNVNQEELDLQTSKPRAIGGTNA